MIKNTSISMSHTNDKKVWVLVSSMKPNAKQTDLEQTAPKVSKLFDEWNSNGKFVWSGPLDNNKSAMAIFEADEEEAKQMYEENKTATSGVLDSYLYEWDALPFLSVLS